MAQMDTLAHQEGMAAGADLDLQVHLVPLSPSTSIIIGLRCMVALMRSLVGDFNHHCLVHQGPQDPLALLDIRVRVGYMVFLVIVVNLVLLAQGVPLGRLGIMVLLEKMVNVAAQVPLVTTELLVLRVLEGSQADRASMVLKDTGVILVLTDSQALLEKRAFTVIVATTAGLELSA